MPVRRIFKTLSYLKIKTENNILEEYRILFMLGRYYLWMQSRLHITIADIYI